MRIRWYDEQLWSRLALAVIVGLLAVFLFAGCKSSFHATKQSVSHHETDSFRAETKQNVLRWDSIIKRDSIYVKDSVATRQVGDTIFTDRWHWEYIYDFFQLEKMNLENHKQQDFRFIARTDTIRVPYPVERKLTKWEEFELEYAAWAMGATCVLLVLLGLNIYRRFKNARYTNINQQR